MRCEWKVERERREEGAGVERGTPALCEANEQGAETVHQIAMCYTDVVWSGLHTNTYLQRYTHTHTRRVI